MEEREALLQRLLEQLLETGATVADVCRAHPELIPEVRRRLAFVRGVKAQMDALFPPRTAEGGNGSAAGEHEQNRERSHKRQTREEINGDESSRTQSDRDQTQPCAQPRQKRALVGQMRARPGFRIADARRA